MGHSANLARPIFLVARLGRAGSTQQTFTALLSSTLLFHLNESSNGARARISPQPSQFVGTQQTDTKRFAEVVEHGMAPLMSRLYLKGAHTAPKEIRLFFFT